MILFLYKIRFITKKILHNYIIDIYNVIMFEIELKAHVNNRENTIILLNEFCTYLGHIKKSDTYYNLKEKNVTCRIRTQSSTENKSFITYKNKSKITSSDNSTYEVNKEYESEISNPEAVEKLLLDSGFEISLTKSKDTLQWKKDTPYGEALIELCTVPPIGDFLELEILSQIDNNKLIHDELKNLILKFGLQLTDIEPRYYSELLSENNK